MLHLGLALSRVTGVQAHLHDLTGTMKGPAISVDRWLVYWGVRPPTAPTTKSFAG